MLRWFRSRSAALRVVCVAVVASLLAPALALATDPPAFSLAETGVDVGEAIPTVMTALGALILVAIGGYFALLLIRKGLQWARTAFR